jgi:hypothetical protein
MNLSECYKKATLYPSIAAILLTIVFSLIDNYGYKSEWLTANDVVGLSIFTAIVYCLIICLLSTTIFLNKIPEIKTNFFLNFLTWFLLPLGFIAVVFIHEMKLKIKYDEKFNDEFVYILILNIPFVIGLIWTYFKQEKSVAAKISVLNSKT